MLVVAHQQRADQLARPLGLGVPAHHELLLVHALDLEPVGRPGAHVPALRPLGDDPLRPLGARLAEHRGGAAGAERREPDRVVVPDDVAQHRFPVHQREAGEVDALVEHAVEQVQLDRHAAPPRADLVAKLHPPLEPGEAALAGLGIHGHHLTVEHRVATDGERERIDQLRVGAVERLPVAGEEPDVAAAGIHQHAHAVELGLVDPLPRARRRVRQRGEHGRDPPRLCPVPEPRVGRPGERIQPPVHPALPAPSTSARSWRASSIPAHASPSASSRSGTVCSVKSVG